MMSMSLCLVLLIAICKCVQYEEWVQYTPKGASDDYVMFECTKLNDDYKDVISKYFEKEWPHKGIHVTVWPPPKLQGQGGRVATDPGCNIHASYNRDEELHKPKSKASWGMKEAHWIGFDEKLRKKWLKSEIEPLKVAYDNFAKYKKELFLTPKQCSSKKKPDLPDRKYTREWTMQQEITGFYEAQEEYDNYYPLNDYRTASASSFSSYNGGDNANDKHIYSHKSSRVHPNPNNQHYDEDDHQKSKSINTDSESINIPTVFVTLISCMFLFVICTIYTGCIGLIAGGIGYKIKDSRQTTKGQTFDEL